MVQEETVNLNNFIYLVKQSLLYLCVSEYATDRIDRSDFTSCVFYAHAIISYVKQNVM